MAFFNKTKAAGSNLANRIGQSFENAEYDTKISGQRTLRNKQVTEAGQLAYEIYLSGKKTFTDEMIEILERIEDCDIQIENLEQEKAENIAARKEERRSNMEQAYDADDVRDQERAERAAQRRERREAEKAEREAQKAAAMESEVPQEPPKAETKKAPAKKAADAPADKPAKAPAKKAAPKKAADAPADKPASKSKKKAE